MLLGCFILVLHIANVFFLRLQFWGAFNSYSKTEELMYLFSQSSQLTGLCLFFTHGYFNCGSVSKIWVFSFFEFFYSTDLYCCSKLPMKLTFWFFKSCMRRCTDVEFEWGYGKISKRIVLEKWVVYCIIIRADGGTRWWVFKFCPYLLGFKF